MEASQRQQSVWSLIKECVPDSELPEIRAVLGDALIDMYTEIYSEVQMWQQIWLDVHDGKSPVPQSPLADPPAVKELLRSELQLLLLSLRQKAATVGRDEDDVVSQYSPWVVSYALGADRQRSPRTFECTTPNSRPGSSRSSSSSRLSSHSSVEEEIQALRHKLNATHIDEVVFHLKSLLTEECEVLKHEVQVLQESVEQEYLKQSGVTEPSLTELKKERRLIQQDLDALSSLNESIRTNELKADVSPPASRRLKRLAGKVSPVSVSPETLQPKPPSHANRATFPNKTRHRLSPNATWLPGSPSPAQIQRQDLENSRTRSAPQTNPSATMQSLGSESEIAFVGSVECRIKDALLGHVRAASIPMIPSPPAGRRGGSRRQGVGRRLALHQTEKPPPHCYVKPLAADVKPTNR